MLDDFSIGKILLILVLVLIFFGPKKIPDIAQSIGKGIREFKKAMSDVSEEIKKPVSDDARSASTKSVDPPSQQNPSAESKSNSELK